MHVLNTHHRASLRALLIRTIIVAIGTVPWHSTRQKCTSSSMRFEERGHVFSGTSKDGHFLGPIIGVLIKEVS